MLSLLYAKLGDLDASIKRLLHTQQQMTQGSREDMRELWRLTVLFAQTQARENNTTPADSDPPATN